MESRNIFRRRTAVAIKSPDRYAELQKAASTACSHETPHVKPIKFNRINEVRHALRGRRHDQQFLKVVGEIKERKTTFFRMGFRSYQKKENRKVLGDVLGLDTNRAKGTMFLGELWSNREHARFLKENHIYMTKMKLIDKFQTIRKQQEQDERNLSQLEIEDVESSHSLGDFRGPLQSTLSCTRRVANKKICIADNLEEIKTNLKQLRKDSGMNNLISEVRYLQRCQERLDKVERHYFLKMLELQ